MDERKQKIIIDVVLRQTDYTEEQARQKLEENNYNALFVIKDFMGIKEKKKDENVASLNQEIYKQIRYKMDTSMRDYTKRKEMSEKIKAYQEYVKQQMQQK